MTSDIRVSMARRRFLQAGAALLSTYLLPKAALSASGPSDYELIAAPSRVPLLGVGQPDTTVWAYDDIFPGPLLRVPQGRPVRVTVENRLDQETTAHWHGIRFRIPWTACPD